MSFEKEDGSGKSLTEATKLPEQGRSWPEARRSRCVRRSQWPSVCPRGREEAKERMSRKKKIKIKIEQKEKVDIKWNRWAGGRAAGRDWELQGPWDSGGDADSAHR